MDAVTLVATLRQRGVTLRPAGGKIRFRPAELVTPDLLAELAAHKPAVLALLAAEAVAPSPCLSCGSRRRWRCPPLGVRWICPRCHPPHPELAPVEWCGPQDEPGWTMGAILACDRCGRGTACYAPDGRPRHPSCGGR